MNRALQGKYIDLVRDGVPAHELRANGERAVFNALVRVAASARQRGWTRPGWEIEIVSNPASHLGGQVKTTYDKKDNKRRRRTDREILKLLTDAWTTSGKWISEQPAPIDKEMGRARARAVRDWISDADVQMPDAERKILAHAVEVALDRGTDRPTLPPQRDARRHRTRAERTPASAGTAGVGSTAGARGPRPPAGPECTREHASPSQRLPPRQRAGHVYVPVPEERVCSAPGPVL